jgi:hypothetical protein
MPAQANGAILYEGPSQLDGAPIVVIATGLKTNSTNAKTGAMVQTYILRSDIPPIDAVRSGEDASICGGCTHRGDGTGKGRSCYVTLMHGPRGVYAAYKRGSYPKAQPDTSGRMVRLGTYGDPVAAPMEVWKGLLDKAKGWTGYTHQWKDIDGAWAPLVMASVDSETEMQQAHDRGYRTFRVTPPGETAIKGTEVICPASEEAGRRTTCEDCKACMGTSAKARVSIQIVAHGTGKKHIT